MDKISIDPGDPASSRLDRGAASTRVALRGTGSKRGVAMNVRRTLRTFGRLLLLGLLLLCLALSLA